MILKIKLGTGARGLLNYLSSDTKTGGILTSNMAGETPRELAREVSALRRMRPGLRKAVAHLSLSHSPGDRPLSDDEWRRAIRIALDAHGASESAHVAFRHHDTAHDHTHIFFLRVLPNGEVISDSNSFHKNRVAARVIEKELNLKSPTPTQADSGKPGDREAVANALRRSTRRGTKVPGIDPARVRLALQDAKDVDHLVELLALEGIECEFDRRGAERQIYGWRLRTAGSEEWLKASTIARDLSWPKIAHRFTPIPVNESIQAAQKVEAPATAQQYQGMGVNLVTRIKKMQVDPAKAASDGETAAGTWLSQKSPMLSPLLGAAGWVSAQLYNLVAGAVEAAWRAIATALAKICVLILRALGFRVAAIDESAPSLEDRVAIDVQAREVHENEDEEKLEATVTEGFEILQAVRSAITSGNWSHVRALLAQHPDQLAELESVLSTRPSDVPAGVVDVVRDVQQLEAELQKSELELGQ
jgi:hypothetical protein